MRGRGCTYREGEGPSGKIWDSPNSLLHDVLTGSWVGSQKREKNHTGYSVMYFGMKK